jgi:hypothetical protein
VIFNTLPVLRCNEFQQPMSQLGHLRPNEAIDFESALASTPDITLQRTKCRGGS